MGLNIGTCAHRELIRVSIQSPAKLESENCECGGGGFEFVNRSPSGGSQAALNRSSQKPSILTLRRLCIMLLGDRAAFCLSAKPDRDRANADCRSPRPRGSLVLKLAAVRRKNETLEKVQRKSSGTSEIGASSQGRRQCVLLAPLRLSLLSVASSFLITTTWDPQKEGDLHL